MCLKRCNFEDLDMLGGELEAQLLKLLDLI